MVDGINSNQSSEIYKKQNTSSTSSSSEVGNSGLSASDAQFEAWLAEQIALNESDEENLTYDTTGMDLNNLNLDNLDVEPSDFEKGIQIASTLAAGAAQIISALNTGGDGSTSGPSNLESAMKACQADNPTQSDVTALNKYITKAENKLGDKLSAEGKNGDRWKNMQHTYAINIAQQEQNISNINNALGTMDAKATSVEAEIDGNKQTITVNAEAVSKNQDTITKYAGEQAEGESKLHQLNDALNGANDKKGKLEESIAGLEGDISNLQGQLGSINPQRPIDPGANATQEQKDKYNADLQNYNQQIQQQNQLKEQLDAKKTAKANAEAQLNEVNGHITQLEGCIQVGNTTLAQIKAEKAQSEQSLDKLQENVTGLKDKDAALREAKAELQQQTQSAKSNKTNAEQAKAQAEREKEKAEKELQKKKKKLNELISEKQQINNAKAIRDAAQAKINGATPPGSTTPPASTTTPGSTTPPASTTTPGSTTLPPVSTTTDTPPVSPASSTPPVSTTIDTPPVSTGGAGNGNVLPEVVVTGSPMKAGESKQVTAKDGSTVTLTKNADGTYDITGLKDGEQKGITAKGLYDFLES